MSFLGVGDCSPDAVAFEAAYGDDHRLQVLVRNLRLAGNRHQASDVIQRENMPVAHPHRQVRQIRRPQLQCVGRRTRTPIGPAGHQACLHPADDPQRVAVGLLADVEQRCGLGPFVGGLITSGLRERPAPEARYRFAADAGYQQTIENKRLMSQSRHSPVAANLGIGTPDLTLPVNVSVGAELIVKGASPCWRRSGLCRRLSRCPRHAHPPLTRRSFQPDGRSRASGTRSGRPGS